MKVYNRNNKSIEIESVELVGAESSPFRINVDGVAGNTITNVEVLKKDSIYMFIEVTVDPLNSNSPLLIRDSIRFRYNGKTQYLQLEAIGQDVHFWKGKIIVNDTTLKGEKPYLIYDSLIIEKNAQLNIEKNSHFYFHNNTKMHIYGTISAKGTIEEPIVFRGDRTDRLFSDVPYDRIPGQWKGITIDSLSYNNWFENVQIRNTVNGILFEQSLPVNKKATFINAIVHNSNSNGISAVNCNIDGYNCLFTNAGGSALKLIGGEYYFLHCTIANYMSWLSTKNGPAITLGNVKDFGSNDSDIVPLNKCEFINSIVVERWRNPIEYQNKLNGNEITPLNYTFRSCLINAEGTDDINFVDTIWNEEPKFRYINKNEDYYYNFELDSVSPAINKADRYFSVELPFDIKGVSRLSDENPDIGCYEWVGTQ